MRQYQALTGCLFLTFCLNGCYRTEKLVRQMTWTSVQERTAVRMSFLCAPNQHVVIESTELLAMLEASGKTRINVEFEVRRAWWGCYLIRTSSCNSGSLMFNVVGVDGHRYGSWVTKDGHAESTETSQHYRTHSVIGATKWTASTECCFSARVRCKCGRFVTHSDH